MVERIVRGKTVSIQGTKCEMQIASLGPGKIFVRLSGTDDGELGRIPFDDLNARLTSQMPVELLIDTSRATGVSNAVTEQWQKWFATRRDRIKKVRLFATSKFFLITAGIIKELSGAGEMFEIYSDGGQFQKVIGAKEWQQIIESGTLTKRDANPPWERRFEGVLSAVRFIRLRPGVVFLKITGRDTGDTLDDVLGALTSELDGFPGPLQVFVDGSETTGVIPRVSESWTRWIAAHRNRLLSIDVLAHSRLVTLIVSAAKIFSRTGDLMNVVDQRSEFLERIETAAPGSSKDLTQ